MTNSPPVENAYKRKKQPELVRRALLDKGIELALAGGLAAVTVQAVASAVGVTKGGFMHHFPTKQSLVDEIFAELMDAIDRELDDAMANDPEPYGSFTRAYVTGALEMDWEGRRSPQAPLSAFMLTDPALREVWSQWYAARMERHRETDGDLKLGIVRLAADGIWLAGIVNVVLPDRIALAKALLASTRADDTTSSPRPRGR